MKKIPTLFQRNYNTDRLVRDEVTPGCEWVLAGEGIATRKWDGTACMIRDGKLYKRYDAKKGKLPKDSSKDSSKQPPPDFEPCQDPDPVTGHWPGWVPVGNGPEDQYHREAFDPELPDNTYELCGPKINGNAEDFGWHVLIRHGLVFCLLVSRTFDAIKTYLSQRDMEGIVFHHPDGRMCKIKTKDFGVKRIKDVGIKR